MNPNALVFFAFGSCVGYLVGENLYSTITGLTICLGTSIFENLLNNFFKG